MTTLTVNTVLTGGNGPQTPDAPAAPALAVSGNTITVTLAADPDTYGLPVNSRGIRYSPDGVSWTNVFQIASPVQITGLAFETRYFVQWRAANDNGAGAWSPSASITTGTEPVYVAPSLSSPAASRNGSNGITGSVVTNKAGTLYVYASTNGSETAATILANGAPQAVAAPGTVGFTRGGLAPETTYYAHLAFTDGTATATAVTNAITTEAQGSGTGVVSAILQRATAPGVAPHMVHFTIRVTGASVAEPASPAAFDPTHQGLVYITDWDDPGAVSDKVVNVPAQWNNLNLSYGKHPAHVYTTPGTYSPVFRVYELDGSFVGEATTTITVQDPDAVFTGNRTILVDPTGAGAGGTYPGSQVFTGFTAAFNAARALRPSTTRILFKRGHTYPFTSPFVPKADVANIYFGAWGTGTKPEIELPVSNTISAGGPSAPGSLFNFGDSSNYAIVFDWIRFQGPWDAATETGGHYRCIYSTFVGNNRRILLNDCEFDGWSWAVGTVGSNGGTTALCVNNCDITNWGDYGIWQSQNDNEFISVIGTAIHQKATARMNGDGKRWDKNQHGPIRFTTGTRSYYSVIDLFSRNGWTSNGGPYGTMPTTQPCMRIATSGPTTLTVRPHITVERAAMEGGYSMVMIKHQNQGGSGGALNVLFDKVLMVATACTWQIFEVQWTGWTVRNTVVVLPDLPTKNNIYSGIFNDYELGVSREDDPVDIHNMTVVNLKSLASLDGRPASFDTDINGTKLATDYTVANTAIYQPGGSPSEAIDVDLATPLATVGGTWTSRFLGLSWSGYGAVAARTVMDTSWASPAGFVTTMVPNAISPLQGDAAGLVAYDDFYGTLRGANPDRGAVEA
jgi:hypothetical protein